MIRHGAELVHAYADGDRAAALRRAAQGVRRRVHRDGLEGPRQRLVRRVADRRDRGDGRAAGAVQILHRRELAAIDDDAERARRAGARSRPEYAERFLNPYIAAERGYVDDVIAAVRHPARPRRRARPPGDQARARSRDRRHSNTPL